MIGNGNVRFEISDEDEAWRVPWSFMSGRRFFFKMKLDVANRFQFRVLWSVFGREDVQVGFGVQERLDDFYGIVGR